MRVGACGVPQSAMRRSDTSAASAGAARPANRPAPSTRIVSFRLIVSSPESYGKARPRSGRTAAGYTPVKTGEMSVYSPDMADSCNLRFRAVFSSGMIRSLKSRKRGHDPGRRMPVRRGAIQGGGRADQRPPLPLPELPEGDGLAVLRPRAVSADGADHPGRDRPLSDVRAARPRVLQAMRYAAVHLAQGRQRGWRRAGRVRRPPRLRADRAHLGLREDGLGQARRRFAAIPGRPAALLTASRRAI